MKYESCQLNSNCFLYKVIQFDTSYTNVALKAEVSFLDGKEGKTSFFVVDDQRFDRNATLYQVALEWVF